MELVQANVLTVGVMVVAGIGLGLLLWRYVRVRQNLKDGRWRRVLVGAEDKRMLWLRVGLLLVSGLLIGMAVLRPQWGEVGRESKSEGVDVLFSLDVSKSMRARDLGPEGRLEATKEMIAEFVNGNPGNRYGLVVFAGEAFVSVPMTSDHGAFLSLLEGVSDADVGEQGTDLGEALAQSVPRFGPSTSSGSSMDNRRGQAVVLFSDGGDPSTSSGQVENEENYLELARQAGEQGVPIVTVGIGSSEGVRIPEGTDVFGRESYKTYRGEPVVTRLNEGPLKAIAEVSGGEYVAAKSGRDLNRVAGVLDGLEQTSISDGEQQVAADRYGWFLAPALVAFSGFVMLTFLNIRWKDD